MEKFDKDSDDIDLELIIDDSSAHKLSEAIKVGPRKAAKYVRLSAAANKKVKQLELAEKVLLAELIGARGTMSATARQELRKGGLASDERVQKLEQEIIDAQEEADILNGLVSVWTGRQYSFKELVKLMDRILSEQFGFVSPEKKSKELEKIFEEGS